MKLVLFFGLILLNYKITGQEKKLDYQVIRNGTRIGNLAIHESRVGDKIKFKLISEIQTRIIIRITAKGTEDAEYEKGILLSSRFTQTVNGKEKINKQTTHKGSHYLVNNKGKETRINQVSIGYNMVCLYTMEPLNRNLIYSDKYSSFLAVIKVKDHHYRIKFPDGNYNEYFYENGTCKSIKVESNLYSITMELLKQVQ